MTSDKAIEILNLQIEHGLYRLDPDVVGAQLLGIEALKREVECRVNAPSEEWYLLPGETKE